jgi:hypothetical protein
MLPRRLALTCAFILGISPVTVAAPEDFYRAHFQPGVKMGMSLEELKAARPGARVKDWRRFDPSAPPPSQGALVRMAEVRHELDRYIYPGYCFKEGKLSAVEEQTGLYDGRAQMPIEQAQAAVNKLADELKANFVLKGQEQVVRTIWLQRAALVTAHLWEDKANDLHLYLVATNQEIDLVIFDPKAFARADFFGEPEGLEKAKASIESIRRQLGDRADPPLPLIDLLAKPTTEKK